MAETLDMERTTEPATDREIEAASQEILDVLRDFESPKDAGSAFTLAHFAMIKASFPPEFRKQAIDALDAHTQLVKDLINEGYQ